MNKIALQSTNIMHIMSHGENFTTTHLGIQGTCNVSSGQIKLNMTITSVVITL
jgi:hypothetical protein